jgi:hypothetical protein
LSIPPTVLLFYISNRFAINSLQERMNKHNEENPWLEKKGWLCGNFCPKWTHNDKSHNNIHVFDHPLSLAMSIMQLFGVEFTSPSMVDNKDGDRTNNFAIYLYIEVCGLITRILVHINPRSLI